MNHVTTAARQRPTLGNSLQLEWLADHTMRIADLRAMAGGDCRARDFLRFARAPYVLRDAHGWIIGDLRFDRAPPLEFAELRVAPLRAHAPCATRASWTPPRSDVLGASWRSE